MYSLAAISPNYIIMVSHLTIYRVSHRSVCFVLKRRTEERLNVDHGEKVTSQLQTALHICYSEAMAICTIM